jgi:hypothetical protein
MTNIHIRFTQVRWSSLQCAAATRVHALLFSALLPLMYTPCSFRTRPQVWLTGNGKDDTVYMYYTGDGCAVGRGILLLTSKPLQNGSTF